MKMYTNAGSKLLLAGADVINIVGNSTISIKEQFIKIVTHTIGLIINETKTKYMNVSRQPGSDNIEQSATTILKECVTSNTAENKAEE